MELINNQVHLTQADLQYIVDNIDIDCEGNGRVVLRQGIFELTISADFYSFGFEDSGGSYGYDYERVWVHNYWERPHDIYVDFYADDDDTDIEYGLEESAIDKIEYALESKKEY